MGQNTEEIVMRMTLDAASVQRGTMAMIDVQRKAAADYSSFWKRAIADREQAEIAADVRSATRANRARALLRDRAIIQAERQAVTNAEIAAGSIPANLAGKAASKTEEGLLNAGAGAAGVGIVKFLGRIGRFVKSITSGNWERAALSISKLGVGLSAIPVIGTGIAAIIGNISMRKSLNEMSGHYGTDAAFGETAAMQAKSLSAQIALLQKNGRISPDQASSMQSLLATGGMTGVNRVQSSLRSILPHGFETSKDFTEMARLDEEHARAMLAIARDRMTPEQRLTADMSRQSNIKSRMAYFEKDSVEYKRLQLDLDSAIREDEKDLADIAEKKAQKEKESAEQKKRDLDLRKELKKNEEEMGQTSLDQKRAEASFYSGGKLPSIEDLASGGGFLTNLRRSYGAGGRFDLTAGSPFKSDARELQQLQYQYAWNILHPGETPAGVVSGQKSRIDTIMDAFNKSGIGPGAGFDKMNNHLQDLKIQNGEIRDALVKDGILIAATKDN